MSDNNPVKQEVQTFDKKCLKKTSTAEKNNLPTKEGESGGFVSGLPLRFLYERLFPNFPFRMSHCMFQ